MFKALKTRYVSFYRVDPSTQIERCQVPRTQFMAFGMAQISGHLPHTPDDLSSISWTPKLSSDLYVCMWAHVHVCVCVYVGACVRTNTHTQEWWWWWGETQFMVYKLLEIYVQSKIVGIGALMVSLGFFIMTDGPSFESVCRIF